VRLFASMRVASSLAMIVPSIASAQLFTPVSPAESGIDASFSFNPAYGGIERMTGAAAVGDFNGDGWQDLFVPSDFTRPARLYLNNTDGSFTESSASWGLTEIHGGLAASAVDYDNDGDIDLFVASVGPENNTGPGHNKLYRNDGGVFTDVAAQANLLDTSGQEGDGFGAAFGDPDGDGDLDLFIASWKNTHQGNRLFINNDGVFTDATNAWFGEFFDANTVHGFTPKFVDTDRDLDQDLLISGDFGTSQYFRNDGGVFTPLTPVNGTGLDTNGMGGAVGDFNADGTLDWYVSSIFYHDERTGRLNGNKLYLHDGAHGFSEVSTERDCRDGAWGWGVSGQDFNHDGELDIAETNGWFDPVMTEGAKLFLCQPDHSFSEVGVQEGLTVLGEGRSLVTLDYDNDADLDIVIVGPGEPVRLFRNSASEQPEANAVRFVLDPSGVESIPPHGLGARVEILLPGLGTRVRYLDGGPGFLGTSEHTLHFGTGAHEQITAVRVYWPNGDITTMPEVSAGVTRTIHAGGGPGDLNADGRTDVTDLGPLLASWGSGHPGYDLNQDGAVDSDDLGMLLAGWGG